MHVKDLKLKGRNHPIVIDSAMTSATLAQQLSELGASNYALLTDSNVVKQVGLQLFAGLTPAPVVIELAAGEQQKNLANVELVIGQMLQAGLDRSSVLLCFGGGVIGDLGGFCAASFMRGIDFVQIPTTLLAQVDAAIGGKTGVNHQLGKNMIGAFHQPRKVLIDPGALVSLPKREYNAGIAEIIKAALIASADFFAWLEQHQDAIVARDPQVLEPMIARAANIKVDIVERDEHERSGARALLNLGHSFGHAIETEYNYSRYLHGEAVAIGMNMAAYVSRKLGNIDPSLPDRLAALCDKFSLPTNCPDANPQNLFSRMRHDKKNAGNNLRLVLLADLGTAYLESSLSAERIGEFLQDYLTAN